MDLSEFIESAPFSENEKAEIEEIYKRNDIPEDIKNKFFRLIQDVAHKTSELEKSQRWNEELQEDLKVQIKRQRDLQNRLIYNSKSGLANHNIMDRNLSDFIEDADNRKDGRCIVLYMVSLDENFDMIKKTLPNSIVEWIIFQTADRIKEFLPENGRLYHSREDEFIIILIQLERSGFLQDFANRVVRKVSEQYKFPGYNVTIGCNIGFSVYPDHAKIKTQLLRNADIALSAAKKENCRSVMYNREMSVQVIEKMELQNSILKALEEQAIVEINKQFQLYFQPIVEIEDFSEGEPNFKIIGSEALIRWNHPLKGKVPPTKFIPLAEESGLIIPIGYWVLYGATEELKRWQKHGLEDIFVSVNISSRQFRDENLITNVKRVLARKNINPSSLILEITESSVMEDPQNSVKIIDTLRELGVQVSIDDFGTGYSSLNYIKQFSINTLKIDKSFIDEISENDNNKGIVRAIIAMAKSIAVNALAEGIEQKEQAEFLFNAGCKLIQGYYFGRPVPAQEFLKRYLVAKHKELEEKIS